MESPPTHNARHAPHTPTENALRRTSECTHQMITFQTPLTCAQPTIPVGFLVWGGVANWGGIRPKNGNEVLFNILKSILKLIWSRCSRGRSARCGTAGSPQTGRSWTRQIWSSSGWEVYLIISSVVNYKRENLQGGQISKREIKMTLQFRKVRGHWG